MAWWRGASIYQVYIRSFCDSNSDGQGDLPGVLSKFDYIAGLGVDAIWLSPLHPSPNRDWGYDVSDYEGVQPDYGTLEDFQALLEAVPSIHDGRTILRAIPGVIPSLTNPPPGCRFHPRCLRAVDECSRLKPEPISLGPSHNVACHLYQAGQPA